MDVEALEGILNFRIMEPDLATGGQPDAAQLEAVAHAGFEVVIDLALLDADYSLPDEPERVRALGMVFEHIPVQWTAPALRDLWDFFAVMHRHRGRRIFVHCAANMRVSVFLALYRILELGWPQEPALAQVREIWEPDAVWQAFIDHALASAHS